MSRSTQEQKEMWQALVCTGDIEAKLQLHTLQKRLGELPNAQELYPDCADKEEPSEYFYATGDYEPLLQSMGSIRIRVDAGDYHGDSRVLYEDSNGVFGYLLFGWGSCSGCDSLRACDSYADMDALMEELWMKIRWFSSKAAALSFFQEHDWEGDYTSHDEEQADFIAQCVQFLAPDKAKVSLLKEQQRLPHIDETVSDSAHLVLKG